MLRNAEDTYRNAAGNTAVHTGYFPDLATSMVCLLSFAVPEIGMFFLLNYILNQLTNNTIPSLGNKIIDKYHDILLDANGLDEEKINQNDLILVANPLRPIVNVALMIGNPLPFTSTSLVMHLYLDKMSDELYRQYFNPDLAKIDRDGMCHGLMMMWYAYLMEDREADFFETFRKISLNVKSYFRKELDPKQKMFIDTIADIQKQNIQASSNSIHMMNKQGNLIEFNIQKNFHNVLSTNGSLDIDTITHTIANYFFNIARLSPNCLIALNLFKPDGDGHVIGLSSINANEKSYLYCFDCNYKRIRFCADIEDELKYGIESLANLLKYEYRSYFENIPEGYANISLNIYSGHSLILKKNNYDAIVKCQRNENIHSLLDLKLNHIFWRQAEKNYLETNRHRHPKLQYQYDRQFSLVPYGKYHF